MKCAIYARVSTEEQAKKYSIPAQLESLRNFAQANNYEIFKEYVDEGISGTTSDRPQLGELFNDAEKRLFKIANKLEKLELEDEKILRLYRKDIITENQVHS